MKKARLMLTGIVLLALVGGAFAFKAQKKGSNIWCTTFLTLDPSYCNPFINYTFALNNAGQYWCTGVQGAACTFQGNISPLQ